MMQSKLSLTLFFSFGTSVQTWDERGMLEREVAIYRRLHESGINIQFVTYGHHNGHYTIDFPEFNILYNEFHLPNSIYARLIPLVHARALYKTDIIKTNQINGAQYALRAAQLWRKPLIARMGYSWSLNRTRQWGASSPQAEFSRQVEREVYHYASAIVVTTQTIAIQIKQDMLQVANKLHIIPNYVDMQTFAPQCDTTKHVDLMFVGRINQVKNLDKLLDAMTLLPGIKLSIIGHGELEDTLKQQYQHLRERVQWLGRVDNIDLPSHLNQTKIYIQPSQYEGHPKTIIEAMACGLPVIGGDSPGIRELIQHGETGWLTQTDPQSIRDAIQHLLNNPVLCDELGQNARHFVEQSYALDKVVEMELAVIESVRKKSR